MAVVIFTEITTVEDAMPSMFYLGVINLIKGIVSDTARHWYSHLVLPRVAIRYLNPWTHNDTFFRLSTS